MRAMVPQPLAVALARHTDHEPEIPLAPGLIPAMASSTTTARGGSTPSRFAAIRNVSGAGFPARCYARINATARRRRPA
jgi:hypothetical protein